MNSLEILNTVTSAFALQYTASAVEYPNTRLDVRSLDLWARISVDEYKPKQFTLSGSMSCHGCVIVQVFSKTDTGAEDAMLAAVAAANVFERRVINGLRFEGSQILVVGTGATKNASSESTGWYQVNVYTDYRFLK
jgi:hypothetical protein